MSNVPPPPQPSSRATVVIAAIVALVALVVAAVVSRPGQEAAIIGLVAPTIVGLLALLRSDEANQESRHTTATVERKMNGELDARIETAVRRAQTTDRRHPTPTPTDPPPPP